MPGDLVTLKKDLEELFEFLDNRYDINSGGCCYVALCLAEELEKLRVPYKLVLYDDSLKWWSARFLIRMSIKHRTRKSIIGTNNRTCYHYAILVDDLGILNGYEEEKPFEISDLNSDDLRWIYETGDWNSCYDTRLNEIIKNYIQLVFKSYEIREGN